MLQNCKGAQVSQVIKEISIIEEENAELKYNLDEKVYFIIIFDYFNTY